MIKPQALRDWLTTSNAQIRANPDTLQMFVDKGVMACRGSPGLGFEYRYKLHLLVTDYAGDMDALMVPVLAWVSTHQPELLASYESNSAAVSYDVDMVDDGKVDVAIDLELTEAVAVVPRADGSGYDVTHLREPGSCGEGGRRWSLYLRDDLIAAWDEPDDGFA